MSRLLTRLRGALLALALAAVAVAAPGAFAQTPNTPTGAGGVQKGSPFTNGQCVQVSAGKLITTGGACAVGGGGTVTTFSVVTANGVSASVANPTTTPAATFTLGAITPTSVHASSTIDADGALLSGSNAGNAGALGLFGSSTGEGIIQAQAAAGSASLLLPTTSGTLAASATSPITLNATTGAIGFVSSAALAGSPTTTTPPAGDNSTKIPTTAFVANALAGINPAVAVSAATTAAADTSGFTYNNGAAGIGATFTGTTNVPITIDGFTFTAVNQRLLVKNDTQSPSGAFNGVYYVTQVQTGILPPILTRALDYDMPSDINSTGAIPVVSGTVNGSTSWLLTSSTTTVGTDPLTYTVFSYNPTTLTRSVATSHIPLIIASYTTGATAGSLTAITNTAAIQWASAYIWAAANTLCTSGQAAGWYYAQYTGSNAATIYQNQYTAPGAPTIPGSPTTWVGSCTSTNAAQTAVTTEQAGVQFTIPANSMGPNGTLMVRTLASTTSGGSNKTIKVRFGTAGTGGSLASSFAGTAVAQLAPDIGISNAGVATAQYSSSGLGYGSSGAASIIPTSTAIDTTQAQTVTITGQLASNTDYMAMIATEIDLRYAP